MRLLLLFIYSAMLHIAVLNSFELQPVPAALAISINQSKLELSLSSVDSSHRVATKSTSEPNQPDVQKKTAAAKSRVVKESKPASSSKSKRANLIQGSYNSINEPRVAAAAEYLSNRPPDYPRRARLRGQQGDVLLRVRVKADGSVAHIFVEESSGINILDNEALKSVRLWRFIPGMRGSQAVASVVLVPISFKLTSISKQD